MNTNTKLPDGIYIGDSRNMKEVKDKTVTLIVTSPPYWVNKEYEEGMTFDEWYRLLESVFKECNRVLVDGGRICINIANICRKPYKPLTRYIHEIAEKIGWLCRGEIIWLKGGGGSAGDCAYGSYRKASNPVLRDFHEYIIVYSKKTFELKGKGESGISDEEFNEFSRSEWTFLPESRPTKAIVMDENGNEIEIKHPTSFPDELPRRCILFFSNIGDVILDPFAGSGTTFKVAKYLKRKAIIYEKEKKYIPIILKRIKEEVKIQSKGWTRYKIRKSDAPDLVNKSIRELREIAEKMGITASKSLNKSMVVKKIIKERKKMSLHSWFNQVKNA